MFAEESTSWAGEWSLIIAALGIVVTPLLTMVLAHFRLKASEAAMARNAAEAAAVAESRAVAKAELVRQEALHEAELVRQEGLRKAEELKAAIELAAVKAASEIAELTRVSQEQAQVSIDTRKEMAQVVAQTNGMKDALVREVKAASEARGKEQERLRPKDAQGNGGEGSTRPREGG